MKYVAYIDDVRGTDWEWLAVWWQKLNPKKVILRSADEAIDFFEKNGCPMVISFDHDLGDGKDSIAIVKYMIEKDLNMGGNFIPRFFNYEIHSANPVGRENIDGVLGGYLKYKKAGQ